MVDISTVKIQKAEARIDGEHRRLFVTIGGIEYLLPIAKPFYLAQGYTLVPSAWPFRVEERQIFTDLTNEDGPTLSGEVITDPRLTALAIHTLEGPEIEREVTVPTEQEALDAIKAFQKKFIAEAKS